MIRLGEKQQLIVIKKVEFGIYLGEEAGAEETVLLPIKQVPATTEIGDSLEVFIYRDSEDRLIATVREPKIILDQVALLYVKEVGQIGAFLDMGLERDLLLPFKEQTKKVEVGDDVLVALYVDKSERLCATMNVYTFLRTDSEYVKEDRITGRIYQISKEFGVFVAVDDKFSALIPARNCSGREVIGEVISARVTEVKEDGKLDLSMREKAYIQMQTDAVALMEALEAEGGELPFTDKADPLLIKEEMGMSKNEFKRAVGNLLKAGKIEILENSIRIK